MNELQLSSSKLVDETHSESQPQSAWLNNYVSEVWQHPKEHIPEIGAAAVITAGLATGGFVAARRLYNKLEGPVANAVTKDASKVVLTDAAEKFTRMSDKSIANAVNLLKERYSLDVSSWGKTSIQGTQREGLSILRSSNGDALALKTDSETLYAHKINITDGGTINATYYTNEPFHLKNPWANDASTVWPLKEGGPFDGLKQAGIHLLDENKPRALHFTPDLNSLTIKWFDLRVVTAPAVEAPGAAVSSATHGVEGNLRIYSAIDISGPNAVSKGHGLISLRMDEGIIGEPSTNSGRAFKAFFDPAAQTQPELPAGTKILLHTSEPK